MTDQVKEFVKSKNKETKIKKAIGRPKGTSVIEPVFKSVNLGLSEKRHTDLNEIKGEVGGSMMDLIRKFIDEGIERELEKIEVKRGEV